jgi:hypothetical protein
MGSGRTQLKQGDKTLPILSWGSLLLASGSQPHDSLSAYFADQI